MFGFAVLLLVITGLRLSGSHFALMPLGGDRSLLPMSLILIASICMMWTLRYWTTMSHRRTLLGLLISLSATWITALACMEGLTRRDGVFLRTLKTGGSRQRLRTALRLSRVETLLTIALFTSAGAPRRFSTSALAAYRHSRRSGHRVLVCPHRVVVEPTRSTAAGTHIPDNASSKGVFARRVAAGRGSGCSAQPPLSFWRWAQVGLLVRSLLRQRCCARARRRPEKPSSIRRQAPVSS